MQRKLIIISAPSGAGKTSIVRYLLEHNNHLSFSISATSRAKRESEIDGKDYYFLSVEEFKQRIANEDFLEWQEVYTGQYYGTLKGEVDRICAEGKQVIFDVDVLGGLNIKKYYKDEALAIFIKPPTLECLKERLLLRGTETEETLKKRVDKSVYELSFENQFDEVVVNDNLEEAHRHTMKLIDDFICKK